MGVPARQRFTFDEYLLLEEIAEVKHEFLDDEVWAMAGGPPERAAVIGNVTTLLNVQLRGQRCRVYSTELRVRVKATGLGTYPDITVICGRLERDPDDRTGYTAINPRALVEVLSPSTEEYDRGEKLSHYQTIPSLEEVVLVAHDRPEIEVVRRAADGTWSRHIAVADQSARLTSIACDLSVAEVYRDPSPAADAGGLGRLRLRLQGCVDGELPAIDARGASFRFGAHQRSHDMGVLLDMRHEHISKSAMFADVEEVAEALCPCDRAERRRCCVPRSRSSRG